MKKVFIISGLAIAALGLSWVGKTLSKGEITWKAENKFYKAAGSFTEWEVQNISLEDGNIESLSLDVTVNIASLQESNEKLVHHLKAEDFFDVANHPTAIINVSKVAKTDTAYSAQFITTIKNISDTTTAYFSVISEAPIKVAGHTYINRPKHEIGMPLKKSKGTTKMVQVDFEWEM